MKMCFATGIAISYPDLESHLVELCHWCICSQNNCWLKPIGRQYCSHPLRTVSNYESHITLQEIIWTFCINLNSLGYGKISISEKNEISNFFMIMSGQFYICLWVIQPLQDKNHCSSFIRIIFRISHSIIDKFDHKYASIMITFDSVWPRSVDVDWQ